MKKYFTKYLPVEGEIKEGDWVRSPGTGAIFVWDEDLLRVEGDQKMKLFLCSRDIQVGDRVYDIQSQLYGKITEGGNLIDTYNMLREDEMELIATLDPIKVIGEISPEAAWVTEGMEFDEEEIRAVDKEEKIEIHPDYVDDWGREDIYWEFTCPTCKRFH